FQRFSFQLFRFCENRTDAAKFSRAAGAVTPYPHGAAGGQTADIAKHRVRIGHVSPEKETDVTGWIGREIDLAAFTQCLYLRGQAEGVAAVGIIEGLNAERIAREEETLSLLIPDGKGVHPAYFIQHPLAAAHFVERQQYLCVAMRPKRITIN